MKQQQKRTACVFTSETLLLLSLLIIVTNALVSPSAILMNRLPLSRKEHCYSVLPPLFATSTSSSSSSSSSNDDADQPLQQQQQVIIDEWDEASTAAVSTKLKPTTTTNTAAINVEPSLQARRTTNIATALLSVLLAICHYVYQYLHPVTPLSLLVQLQSQSAPLSLIGKNNKPTVIDFWAPWCTNCQYMAGTLASIEHEYSDSVNFIMVNGDERDNGYLVDMFGVDTIPHMAFLDKEGNVETALIGPIPKSVMRADLNVLLKRTEEEELPYVMLDAFQNRPDLRKVSFPEL